MACVNVLPSAPPNPIPIPMLLCGLPPLSCITSHLANMHAQHRIPHHDKVFDRQPVSYGACCVSKPVVSTFQDPIHPHTWYTHTHTHHEPLERPVTPLAVELRRILCVHQGLPIVQKPSRTTDTGVTIHTSNQPQLSIFAGRHSTCSPLPSPRLMSCSVDDDNHGARPLVECSSWSTLL
ncbi:hypothetical protein LX36DRAFT_127434 [Colletotrichum falcatum]|nr:hypothetical protein LX36DRAFT_127434 [Colletotrichum falcatum]